jgi:hypoxanthine phosphoribosyltransferase
MLTKLFSRQQIEERVSELASLIHTDFDDERLLFVCLLKGSFMFTSDLVRYITNPCSIDFIRVASYGSGMSTSGTVRILKDLEVDIEGENVIIVEDIIDSGLTLKRVKEMLAARRPKALKICALLDKRARRQVELEGDYVGFSIEDAFVVGYGIDYAEDYRNLPEIFVVEADS